MDCKRVWRMTLFKRNNLISVCYQCLMEIETLMLYRFEMPKLEPQHVLTTWLLFDSTF